jgi:4-hydroxybenzoate polyprenyltransferase
VRALDFFFLTRPTLIFVVWLFILVGARHTLEASGTTPLAILLLQYFCIFASAFVVNQLHDREGDAENKKLPTLSQGLVSESEATHFAWGLFAAGLVIALTLGYVNFFLTLIFYLLVGVFYNKPPLTTKDDPILGPITLSLAYFILVAQGAALGGGFSLLAGSMGALPIVLAGLAISLLAMIPDMHGDQIAAKRTFPLVYGVDKTWLLAIVLFLLGTILALLSADYQLAIPCAFTALASLIAFLKHPVDRAESVAKLGILVQALFLVPDFPFLLLLMPIYYFAARAYHKKRFDMTYPSIDF